MKCLFSKLGVVTIALLLINVSFSYSQTENKADISKEHLEQISFYTDYKWKRKSIKNTDSTIYRNELKKHKVLGGIATINKSLDASEESVELSPFLIGISGWDPVEKQIKFLDFSRDGMMVEGTISLKKPNTVQYDFKFAYPGNNKKLTGRDMLEFNQSRTEFVWKSLIKNKKGEYTLINEDIMIRAEKIES